MARDVVSVASSALSSAQLRVRRRFRFACLVPATVAGVIILNSLARHHFSAWSGACSAPRYGVRSMRQKQRSAFTVGAPACADAQADLPARMQKRMEMLRELTEVHTPAELLSVVESYGLDPKLGFSALHASAALHALAKMREQIAPDVANSLVMTKLGDTTASLLANDDGHVQTLSITLWAVATLREAAPQLVAKIVPPLVEAALKDKTWVAQGHLGRVIWATATLRKEAPELRRLLPELIRSAPSRIEKMSGHNVANIIWAAATMREEAPELQALFPVLVKRAFEVVNEMTPKNAGNIVWATNLLGVKATELRRLLPEVARIACPDGIGMDKVAGRGGVGGGWQR